METQVNLICPICGGETDTAGRCIKGCLKPIQPTTGWICPVCGAGVSPYATKCNCNETITNSGNIEFTNII